MDNTLQMQVSRPFKFPFFWRVVGWIRRLVILSVDLYTAGFLFYFITRAVDEFWYNAFVGLFLQWWLLPIFVMLPLTFFWKSKVRIAAVSLLCILYLATYGTLFLPNRSQAAPEGAETLTVISYNSATGRTTPDHMKWLIEDENPDIMGLMEVSNRLKRYIESDLDEEYPYRIYTEEGSERKALLSKYPIESYEIFYMVTTRPNIEAHLNVNGKPLTVFVVHPPSPDLDREFSFFAIDPANRPETKMLLERTSSDTPTLLLGDFNFTDQSKTYDWVKDAGFTDMHRAVGEGFGHTWVMFGSDWTLTRIDYVWVSSQHFIPLESHVGLLTYADHRPVVAKVAWK